MPADTMELTYGVIGEIGADVADITISGETSQLLYLPGADILLLAGLTVVAAFFRGLLTGVVAGTGTPGEDLGRSLVRRFTGLLAPGGDDDGDVLADYRQTAAEAEAALTGLGVAAGALGGYAAGAQAEVAAALRSLGLRDERVQVLAPAATTRLIGQLGTDLAAT